MPVGVPVQGRRKAAREPRPTPPCHPKEAVVAPRVSAYRPRNPDTRPGMDQMYEKPVPAVWSNATSDS